MYTVCGNQWKKFSNIYHLLKDLKRILNSPKEVFSCFEPFNQKPADYARSTLSFEGCKVAVDRLFASIWANTEHFPAHDENDLNIKVNTLVIRNAEKYYRTAVQSDALSWNVRDEHMVEVINELINYHGEDAKIIVWEHNTHIGDASATDMKHEGIINVGQLIREQNKKEDVFAVGFGTHRGTVIAADQWGVPFKKIEMPPAIMNSWEDILHNAGPFNKILIFTGRNRQLFDSWVGHRAIGVVYNPAYEAYGNYVPSKISDRYDAFIYIDETKALVPLEVNKNWSFNGSLYSLRRFDTPP